MGETKKFADAPKPAAPSTGTPWGLVTTLNENGKAAAGAYQVAIPEVGVRPTEYASVKTNQGNPSA